MNQSDQQYQVQLLEETEPSPHTHITKHTAKVEMEPLKYKILHHRPRFSRPPITKFQPYQPPQQSLLHVLYMLDIAGCPCAKETLDIFRSNQDNNRITPSLWLVADPPRLKGPQHTLDCVLTNEKPDLNGKLHTMVTLLVYGIIRVTSNQNKLSIPDVIADFIITFSIVKHNTIRCGTRDLAINPSVQVGDWWTYLHRDWTRLSKLKKMVETLADTNSWIGRKELCLHHT